MLYMKHIGIDGWSISAWKLKKTFVFLELPSFQSHVRLLEATRLHSRKWRGEKNRLELDSHGFFKWGNQVTSLKTRMEPTKWRLWKVILLMAEILHQLRLVVYPIIYRVSYIPRGARFQPSTVCLAKNDGQCLGPMFCCRVFWQCFRTLPGRWAAWCFLQRWDCWGRASHWNKFCDSEGGFRPFNLTKIMSQKKGHPSQNGHLPPNKTGINLKRLWKQTRMHLLRCYSFSHTDGSMNGPFTLASI